MSRILYGVSGEGSGHSSRASLIAAYLESQGHQIKIATYDRGYRNLKDQFDTLEIAGLSIVSEDNQVSKLKTITANLAKIPSGTRSLKQLKQTFADFAPDVVLTDFEPTTAYLASHFGLPLITIDNQHRMRYMQYDMPPALKQDALITETIIRAMVPMPWASLITTFHFNPLKNERSFLFPPILREAVLDVQPRETEKILVYTTSGFDSLLNVLRHFNRENFCVYGYDRDEVDGNLHFRPFSKVGFLQDLAECKAVIATAGFTLISEALHLAKPYLAFPMQGQFEQQLNAFMLEQQGYGAQCNTPDRKSVAAFLYDLQSYKAALEKYPRAGNGAIKEKLSELLADDLRLLKTFAR
ncbi:MAG: hypothetical protein NVV73_10520 [Cellvibrionaceae bacterium]|nr:hypothetical protein [Cellvibrionaceae bacterium]